MEIWKDVVGFENYFQVSNKGNIFSKRTNKLIKLCKLKTGYLSFATKIDGRKGKSYCFRVNILVAKAFIPNPNNLPLVNHKDGVKTNNNVDNLEWCTHQENVDHAKINGLVPKVYKGETNSQSKLTQEEVDYVRFVYKPRDKIFGLRALSKLFGIHHSNLGKIISYKRYN